MIVVSIVNFSYDEIIIYRRFKVKKRPPFRRPFVGSLVGSTELQLVLLFMMLQKNVAYYI